MHRTHARHSFAWRLFLTYPEHDSGFKGFWFTQLVPVASYRRRFNCLLLIWPNGEHLPIPSQPI